MERALASIPARSRKQVMEWGLVLASQGMEAIINHGENGWELLVESIDYDRARQTLRQYQVENKGWRWRQPVAMGGTLFDWGSLGWVAVMIGIFYWSTVSFPAAKSLGIVDSDKVAAGQWWRLFTAVSLHENIPHLAANVTTGFILLGLAMARFGGGVALLASFLAGVAGNLASLEVYPGPHESLGASGMVTGALGLVTAQTFAFWRRFRQGRQFLLRAVAAGALILVLIGFSPGADIAAHLGGFIAGAMFGGALGAVRYTTLQRAPINVASVFLLAAIMTSTWLLALRAR